MTKEEALKFDVMEERLERIDAKLDILIDKHNDTALNLELHKQHDAQMVTTVKWLVGTAIAIGGVVVGALKLFM